MCIPRTGISFEGPEVKGVKRSQETYRITSQSNKRTDVAICLWTRSFVEHLADGRRDNNKVSLAYETSRRFVETYFDTLILVHANVHVYATCRRSLSTSPTAFGGKNGQVSPLDCRKKLNAFNFGEMSMCAFYIHADVSGLRVHKFNVRDLQAK
jgi:hypothetical protein